MIAFPKPAAMIALLLASASCTGAAEGGVIVFDPDFTAETMAVMAGGATSPDGLTWHEGLLYVADEGGSAIRRLGPRGWETLADARSGIQSPEDIVVNADGRVFFTDDSAGGLWVVADGGAKRIATGGVGNAPTEGLALGPKGQLLIGNARTRDIDIMFDESGDLFGLLGRAEIPKPESIAVGSDGSVWVADNQMDVLYRFESGAARPARLSWPGVSPESIVLVGPTLWMTDSHNGKVYRLLDGDRLQTVALFAGKLGNVSGIAGDASGSIYVSIQIDLKAQKGTIAVLRNRR